MAPANPTTLGAYSVEHKGCYDVIRLVKNGTFSFYNKSIGTFYRAIFLVHVCISHYVLHL